MNRQYSVPVTCLDSILLHSSWQIDYALQMTYPSFRDRLFQIAEQKKAHVDWLRDKMRALGGTVPKTKLTVQIGRNSWECLLMDVEAEKRDSAVPLERIYAIAEQTDPEISNGLRRIHEEEKRHRAEIPQLLMKSNPHVALVGNVLEAPLAAVPRSKQATTWVLLRCSTNLLQYQNQEGKLGPLPLEFVAIQRPG